MVHPSGFEDFVRRDYKLLVRIAMVMGATSAEADDAAGKTMEEVLRRWEEIEDPRAYAKRAVLTNFKKARKRDNERIARTVEGGNVTPEVEEDSELTVWEDRQWVMQTLESLPPAQRDVMACIVDGLRPTEIAELLGKTPAAVRKNLQLARERLASRLQHERDEEQTGGRPRSTSTGEEEAG